MRAPVLLILAVAVAACEKNDPAQCGDAGELCAATNDGSTPGFDASSPTPFDDGAAPAPFDAGTFDPAPACKGLFELCNGFDCCSPYTCTNGTCR